MTASRWPVERLSDEIVRLGERGLPRDDFFAELALRLRRVFDFDASCWHTLDPATGLMTSDSSAELVDAGVYTREEAAAAGAGIVASEYLRDDVNTFAALAQRRVPVSILSAATRGRPERSARYREVIAPGGIPYELRAAFVTRGRVWGAVHIARREGTGDFDEKDAAVLARVVPAIAEGIRSSLRFDAARRAERAGPGMIVLGPHDEVELVTDPARELMAELLGTTAPEDSVPIGVLSLAGSARAGAGVTTVAVPGSAGWITLSASRQGGRVAIVIDRAAGRETAALRLETYGVTAREREVATLLAQGCSNAEIAAALVVSPYTVQDHIKSLFEKTGVGSRRELVARVFLDDYLPGVLSGAPLAANGGFAHGSADAG